MRKEGGSRKKVGWERKNPAAQQRRDSLGFPVSHGYQAYVITPTGADGFLTPAHSSGQKVCNIPKTFLVNTESSWDNENQITLKLFSK